MSDPTYTTREYSIPAGDALEVYRVASFLSCLSASHGFFLKFNNGPKTDFEAGLTYTVSDADFERIQIINPSSTTILVVKLGFGRGDIRDARLTIGEGVSMRPVTPPVFATHPPESAADGATTLILPPNPNRQEAIISNNGPSGKVFIGGKASASAGIGIPLEFGAILVLNTTAAIHARNDSGAAVLIGVTQLEHST